jgi:hypothetical protein
MQTLLTFKQVVHIVTTALYSVKEQKSYRWAAIIIHRSGYADWTWQQARILPPPITCVSAKLGTLNQSTHYRNVVCLLISLSDR